MKNTVVVFTFLACLPFQVRADGPSTYEGAGALDAYIKLCSETAPSRAEYYKQLILASASCGKPASELEKNLLAIRESKNSQVRTAYQNYFDKALEPFGKATEKQKQEFCEHFSQVKC